MSANRIGVFVCHCGGNISDHVDVDRVRASAEATPGVAIAKTFQFACSDASQQEMMDAIREDRLDGIVIASCSPKLHLETFRSMARRAGLNQYMYTQANVREQCSWAHRHDARATDKAARLVRAAVARTGLGQPLEDLRVDAVPAVLVVGAGAAGLRAALSLADMGLSVHLVERDAEPGGWIRKWGRLFPTDRSGSSLISSLLQQVKARPEIALYCQAEVVHKTGTAGRFTVEVRVRAETVTLQVGAIVVATGFDPYQPRQGEFGHGLPGVVTLPAFKEILASSKE